MKEKSNTGKYLKYRPKHSFKTTVDFQWKRINVGANVAWKSKILAVDYLMLDERSKTQNDLMDYVRGILFGYSKEKHSLPTGRSITQIMQPLTSVSV